MQLLPAGSHRPRTFAILQDRHCWDLSAVVGDLARSSRLCSSSRFRFPAPPSSRRAPTPLFPHPTCRQWLLACRPTFPSTSSAAGGKRRRWRQAAASSRAPHACGRHAQACWAAPRPSLPPCWPQRLLRVTPVATPAARWHTLRRRARRAATAPRLGTETPRRALGLSTGGMLECPPACRQTGAASAAHVPASTRCRRRLLAAAAGALTRRPLPARRCMLAQARALESTLKEINSRFGKNSIMKMGETTYEKMCAWGGRA